MYLLDLLWNIPCGILTIPVLFILIASTTLFNDIPNDEELYDIFHSPFGVFKKNIGNKEYPYLNIRVQERHIRKVMKECEIPDSVILIDLNVPHAINFF